MRTKKLIAVVCIVGSIFITQTLLAKSYKHDRPRKAGKFIFHLLNQEGVDENKDKKISQEELKQYLAKMIDEHWEKITSKLDQDEDGLISTEEMEKISKKYKRGKKGKRGKRGRYNKSDYDNEDTEDSQDTED